MRTVIFHCRNYRTEVVELSDLPKNIKPEEILENNQKQELSNCVVALVTVESKDNPEVAKYLISETSKMAQDVGTSSIVILPFAHLSNDLAPSDLSLSVIKSTVEGLKGFNVMQAHFGSHKELLLDVYGHPRNVRYREF